MIKHKDNFTDIVEGIQNNQEEKPEPSQHPEGSGKNEWQVTDNEGNTVTLGQKPGNRKAIPNKANTIELSQELGEAIKKAVEAGIKDAMEKWEKRQRRGKA